MTSIGKKRVFYNKNIYLKKLNLIDIPYKKNMKIIFAKIKFWIMKNKKYSFYKKMMKIRNFRFGFFLLVKIVYFLYLNLLKEHSLQKYHYESIMESFFLIKSSRNQALNENRDYKFNDIIFVNINITF